MDDFAALVDEALEELDRLDGTVVPEIIEVPDGHYTERLVMDETPKARWVKADDPPEWGGAWHVERCDPIPRYKRELRWVRREQ